MTPEDKKARHREIARLSYHRRKRRFGAFERQRWTKTMGPQERAWAWLERFYPDMVDKLEPPTHCPYTGLALAYARERAKPQPPMFLLPDAAPVLRKTPTGAEVVSALANRQLNM